MATPFSDIYDRFFGKITDDMYFIWTKEDTERDIENILIDAIPGFEFPRFPLYDYTLGPSSSDDTTDEDLEDEIINLDESKKRQKGDIINLDDPSSGDSSGGGSTTPQVSQFNCDLTSEEINILALLMYNTWLQRQIASIENTRMKYSGSDFKMTSQANHLDKLIKLKQEAERQDRHAQRLYKRHKFIDDKGSIKSNWSTVMEKSVFDD